MSKSNKGRQRKASHVQMICDGKDMYVVIDGVKIAKRGHKGTPQAKTWVSLEPGWSVIDTKDGTGIEVAYEDVPLQ
ncbi:MAG: hypothetical protein IT536_08275 [Hyphomicrobiales bacterium]|nr:hypothetical protein [Hyphomicrobiales bacterium]